MHAIVTTWTIVLTAKLLRICNSTMVYSVINKAKPLMLFSLAVLNCAFQKLQQFDLEDAENTKTMLLRLLLLPTFQKHEQGQTFWLSTFTPMCPHTTTLFSFNFPKSSVILVSDSSSTTCPACRQLMWSSYIMRWHTFQTVTNWNRHLIPLFIKDVQVTNAVDTIADIRKYNTAFLPEVTICVKEKKALIRFMSSRIYLYLTSLFFIQLSHFLNYSHKLSSEVSADVTAIPIEKLQCYLYVTD